MRLRYSALILLLLIFFAGTAQPENKPAGKKPRAAADSPLKRGKEARKQEASIYQETVLEDFEKNAYADTSARFLRGAAGELVVKIVSETPAPNAVSKKYLSVKFRGQKGDVLELRPAAELSLTKHCREIGVWVLGRRFPAELSLVVADTRGKEHRLVFGNVNFSGWRRMKVRLGQRIIQRDEVLNQKKILRIVSVQYRPDSINPELHQIYLDDLTADLRERYLDIPKKEW